MHIAELLYNAEIINEGCRFHGWLTITTDGRIDRIGKGTPPPEYLADINITHTDIKGHWLIPGVIDSHVHFREPGLTHKASIFTESRAAAAGGVTSFMDMPNTKPLTITHEALDEKFKIAEKDSVINYSFFIGATNENAELLREIDYSRVPGIKLFMGSSTGGMLVDGSNALEKIFTLPAIIMAHCEDENIIRSNTEIIKREYPLEEAPVRLHAKIRSSEACFKSSATAVELARKNDTRLHIAHISTADELALFAKNDDRITAEVCVAHLLFCDEDYENLGTRIKCNPAVKSKADRDALRKAVASGLIRTVSTDHAPHTLAEKTTGGLTAPSGMPMVQFSLPAMLDLAAQGHWSVETVVDRMCHSQAELFHIDKRGFIRPGYWADLTEIDPDACTEVSNNIIISKCGWSPLEGKRLQGKVVTTRVNGKVVYDHRKPELEADSPSAMPLHFLTPQA